MRNLFLTSSGLNEKTAALFWECIGKEPVNVNAQELTQYDMIVFCGGNARTLLGEINRTGFAKLLKQAIENGLVYLGISAGSMVAAGNFSDGLGYLANPLIPHAEENYRKTICLNWLMVKWYGSKGSARKLFDKCIVGFFCFQDDLIRDFRSEYRSLFYNSEVVYKVPVW